MDRPANAADLMIGIEAYVTDVELRSADPALLVEETTTFIPMTYPQGC